MPSMTINFSAADAQRVTDMLCFVGEYQAKLPDGSDNPVSKAAFAKNVLIAQLKRDVRSYERDLARNTAVATAEANLPALPDLT